MSKLFDRIWERVLKKTNSCLCNADSKQSPIVHNHGRFATKGEQKNLLIDKCGNPRKINLRDLKRILESEL